MMNQKLTLDLFRKELALNPQWQQELIALPPAPRALEDWLQEKGAAFSVEELTAALSTPAETELSEAMLSAIQGGNAIIAQMRKDLEGN